MFAAKVGMNNNPVIAGITTLATFVARPGTKIFAITESGKLIIAANGKVKYLIPVNAGIINNRELRKLTPLTTGLTTVLITC